MPRAALLLCILTALCSGCAAKPAPPPQPIVVPLALCPAPPPPRLPQLDAAMPFDAPANVRALLDRDSALRGYIHAVQAALTCYEAQAQTQTRSEEGDKP